MPIPPSVFAHFALDPAQLCPASISTGLINATWRLDDGDAVPRFILQRLNTSVFTDPYAVANNIRRVASYLAGHDPDYLFPAPLPGMDGSDLYPAPDGHFYRLLPYVPGARTFEVVKSPEQAYAAASAFAGLTRRLAGLDPDSLRETLPGFHDLAARFRAFEFSIAAADSARRTEAAPLIERLLAERAIVERYHALLASPGVRRRIMHFDTKISNVLFDETGTRALCVIDLDTLMPGYFFDDVGDMLRTYLSPVSEEETDLERIVVRPDFFRAIEAGYTDTLGDELTATERAHFRFAGELMTYMQALRFLTDFLENDRYYGARYVGHNLRRAWNQAVLLAEMARLR